MSGLPSPDLPAYVCYAVVFIIGAITATSTVGRLLKTHPDRWFFGGTWFLIAAHTFLPVGLFWFLDYVRVIQDTSLFAAIIVAAGYRQIFAGGVQGITMPAEDLRTRNADIRIRIHRTLCDLQSAEYANRPLPDGLKSWAAKPSETPGDVDRYVRCWQLWWSTETGKTMPPCDLPKPEPSATPKATAVNDTAR